MGVAKMGELKNVDVRKVWDHEAYDFTPWLAEHLDKLSVVLERDLELEGTEISVGNYRADIVCRVPTDGTRVLIENQLEWANLQHLGQVMAYLAGLEARIVVWVARGFEEAHLSAFRWLNEHTSEDFGFFAVRIRAVKIEDSPPAPVFEVIERPNEWDRQIRQGPASLSELGQWRRNFWENLRKRHPNTPVLRPGYAGSNVNHKIEELDIRISWWVSVGSNAGAFLARIDKAHDEPVSQILAPYRSALLEELKEAQKSDGFGDDIDVIVDPEKTCSVRLYIDPSDRANWDKIADWLDSRRRIYTKVLTGPPDDDAASESDQ
ncbi:MAG: hypothetical protein OXG52_01265 [bacterium]|nr:hypothetical protein [bacterium]